MITHITMKSVLFDSSTVFPCVVLVGSMRPTQVGLFAMNVTNLKMVKNNLMSFFMTISIHRFSLGQNVTVNRYALI